MIVPDYENSNAFNASDLGAERQQRDFMSPEDVNARKDAVGAFAGLTPEALLELDYTASGRFKRLKHPDVVAVMSI